MFSLIFILVNHVEEILALHLYTLPNL